jgi:hypothetical protein
MNIFLAGLLACFLFTAFPYRSGLAETEQWLQCKQFFRIIRNETHSYGDSAGIAPDFPFNPAMREPDAANVKE